MCGICGEIDFDNKNVRVESVRTMCNVLAHRGPDDEGVVLLRGDQYLEARDPKSFPPVESGFEVAFGHRRL